jgi:hypothetical protein
MHEALHLRGGASKKYFINDNSICIPLFGKEGLGQIFQKYYS